MIIPKIIKKDSFRLFEYPSIDHLNQAMRDMLKYPEENKTALQEMCYAILKGGGYFYDDVAEDIEKYGIFKLK